MPKKTSRNAPEPGAHVSAVQAAAAGLPKGVRKMPGPMCAEEMGLPKQVPTKKGAKKGK